MVNSEHLLFFLFNSAAYIYFLISHNVIVYASCSRINQLKHEKDVEEGMEGQDKETLNTEPETETKEENDEPSPKKIARTEDSASSTA